jgi:phosphatidate cytidylyltransferase
MNENIKRSLSGIVYIILLISSTLFSRTSFLLLFSFFLIVGILEFCNLVNLKKINSLVIGSLLFVIFSFFEITNVTSLLLIFATLFVSIKLIYLLFSQQNIKLDETSKYVYLLGYIVLPIIILTKIPTNIFGVDYKPQMIISIFILIWTNDTFAYVVGKSIGKNKLFESISPKKTIEGFVGGIVFSAIAGILISKLYLQMPIYFWIIISIIVSVFGSIGDLVESKFKRIAGVKDSGNIMPGHGGVLDRLDSVIFVAPFLYFFLQIIQYFYTK